MRVQNKLAAGFLGMLMGALALGYSLCSDPLPPEKKQPSPSDLSAWVRLEIPPTATGFRSHAEGWQEWTALARFELLPTEAAAFVAQNHLEALPPSPPPQELLRRPWFRPGAQAKIYGRDADPQAGRHFALTVWIEPAGRRAVVFLRAQQI